MIARIKKNDTVHVISGKNRGKQGPVIALLLKKGKVMVKGIAVVARHIKPRKATGEAGSIFKKERFISMSCVMPVCTACKKPARVNAKKLDTGKVVRVCNRCKEIF